MGVHRGHEMNEGVDDGGIKWRGVEEPVEWKVVNQN